MGSTAVSRADQIDKVSRSYSPVSFYMDSAVNHPGPVRKGNNKSSESKMNKRFKENSIPLSFYTTTLVYYPAPDPDPTYESLMYIFVPNEEKLSHQLSFYMDPTLSHPARKIYIPFSTADSSLLKSVANLTFRRFQEDSSQSKSVANVTVPCFQDDSSQSKSVANVTFHFQSSGSMAKVSFGSFDSQSSQFKPTESKVSELKPTESKVSFGSRSSELKPSQSKLSCCSVGSDSSESKSSQSKLSFRSSGSDSSESKSSESKLSFRSSGSDSSESKSSESKLSFRSSGSDSCESKSSQSKLSFRSSGSDSSESKSSESKLSFRSSGSDSSESKSSQSKLSFGSFGSDSSELKFIFGSFDSLSSQSKSVAKVSKNYIPLSTAGPSSKSKVSRNSIPDKVAFSILSKLPVNSLKRFGCVSKSWSILFENTDFLTMYTNHSISCHGSDDDYHTFILTNHCLGYRLYHSEFHLLDSRLKLNLPSPLQRSRYYTCILGSTSVNGIFCLGQTTANRDSQSLYVLWNPLTQEFMVIPSSPAELTPKHRSGMTVYMEHVIHGFGYDQLRHDFKLIQYVSFGSHLYPWLKTSFVEIYSLKNNSWRMIDMDNDLSHWGYIQCRSFYGFEVYLDGACHWLVSDCINHRHAMTLLSFDLTNEVFITTPIGEEPYNPYSGLARLTVLNGSIALISNYHDDLVFQISILGKLGVSESWIKLYTYGPLPSIQWPPIGFGKMGPIFFNKKDYEVVYVDLSTQIIEEVGITSGKTNYNIGGLYKESLLSLKDHVTRSLQGKSSFVAGSCN